MKSNIYIQEIEKFNDEISIWKLIDRHFDIIWKIIVFFPLLFVVISFLIFVNYNLMFFVVSAVLLIDPIVYILKYMDTKRELTIQQKYHSTIQGDKDLYSRVIPEIQKQKLTELINSRLVLNKDNLSFLIESLKSKKDENKYLYPVTSVAVTIVISTILVLLARYLDFYPTIEEFGQIAKMIIAILLPGLALAIYIDKTIIKEYVLTKERKQNRIIRTLENIYLEISNE
ncbi:MAG: hypothetical protein ACFNVV_04445 [Bacteroidota bacterium]